MYKNYTPATNYSTPSIEQSEPTKKRPIPSELKEILKAAEDGNICDLFDDSELAGHFSKVTSGIQEDEQSMDKYLKKYKSALLRARMQPENEKKNFPFENASNVVLPYLFDAASDFNARTSPALLERQDICYAKINGRDEHKIPPEIMQQLQQMASQGPEGEQMAQQAQAQIMRQMETQMTPKAARAKRVTDMINYDLNFGICEWRSQTDKMTMMLPIGGMMFRKIWQCPLEDRRKSELVWPDKMIYDHESDTFKAAPRKSFEFVMTRNDVITAVRTGQFKEFTNFEEDTETQEYNFIESHCEMDLDGDGYCEPYIAVICKMTSSFVSIVPRFDEEDITISDDNEVAKIEGEDFFTQTIFLPDPTGTAVGLGYGIIAGDMYSVIDTNTNQMIDAGTLNNLTMNSGIIRQGSRIGARAGNRQKKGTLDIQLGKMNSWESDGTTPLQNDIAQLPFAGPSEPLRQLLESLKIDLREMVAASQTIDANPGEAASLYLARLHQALIKPNSIMVRVFQGLTDEFQRIYDIHKRYLTQEQYSEVLDEAADKEADYNDQDFDIKTTADPSQGSEIERTARAETQLQMAMQLPQVFNLRYAAVEWAKSIGADVEKFVPEPQPGQPDPIQLIVAQAQQTMSEAEKLKGEADMIESRVKMLLAQIEVEKLPSEIEKTESETIKNLSQADKNESDADKNVSDTIRENYKTEVESIRGALNDFNVRAERLAQTSGNTALPTSPTIGNQSP